MGLYRFPDQFRPTKITLYRINPFTQITIIGYLSSILHQFGQTDICWSWQRKADILIQNQMYLRRDRIILKQIAANQQHQNWAPLQPQKLNQLSARAHQQLSLNKTIHRQIDYSKIELFLLLAPPEQRSAFYLKLKHDLAALFADERAQKTFENKWTLALRSNVMACFNRIAKDFFKPEQLDSLRPALTGLYVDTIDKLLTQEKMSRIEQKFLEPYLVEAVKMRCRLQEVVGMGNFDRLRRSAMVLAKIIADRQTPKTLTSNQFLKYCAMRVLQTPLPHEKYLHNQLLHAPNPKYLFPFRCRGTFLSLTNELLLKSNKLDMVGCQFWSYYEYEEGDLYERMRRAAEWGGRVDVLLMLIGPKLVVGLERCLNLINEKVIYFSSKHITDEGINSLMALVQTALNIFRNRSRNETLFESALQKVDIRQAFQQPLLQKETRLRAFASALLQLYFIMIHSSAKKALRLQTLSSLGCQTTRLLQHHQDAKFTADITAVVAFSFGTLAPEERAKFMFGVVETANQDWESSQYDSQGNIIAPINVQAVRMLAELVGRWGFADEGKADYKMIKLNFYYILALNFKQSDYFQSKQKLSRTLLDINPSLTNNTVFRVLETRRGCYDSFIAHLQSLYGPELTLLNKLEFEGLMAAIDQLVTYRIQQTKVLAGDYSNTGSYSNIGSFYALLVSFLEQVERIEPQGRMLRLVREYFIKCKRTYLIEVFTLKGRDETRADARVLITKDVSYLVEGCVSANPNIAGFCWEILQEYIQRVPELAIYTDVLVVWAECLSILYRKSNQEYESRSEKLKIRGLAAGTLIPTENKEILARMNTLMRGLYGVVLRGHMIDNDYLGVRVQYLIRENCKSASFGFGWKLLKHLTNSFKDDREFIAKEILTNNSCSWFVNEEYFNSRLAKVKPQKILMDKYLIPLHEGEVDREELRKIFMAVEPQVEIEFVTIPPKSSEREVVALVAELNTLCGKIIEAEEHQIHAEDDVLEQHYSSLFDVISRVKMIYITKWNQAVVFSRILDVCRRFVNFRLLEHILLKIVPFFYCLNEFNWKIVETLAEFLHFVVNQLNTSCQRPVEVNQSETNTFDARLDQFTPLIEYENKQPPFPGQRHKAHSFHEKRVSNLKLMYAELVRFFRSHMHVCIAKGFSLSLLLRVFSTNFLLDRGVLPQLTLESVCTCLLSQLELVNVLKSALEKGESAFDATVVDNFYVKTIKSALFHFQKEDFSFDQLVTPCHNKQLKQRIDFFVQICDYLRNDDFHQLSIKKLPKRNEIFARRQTQFSYDRIDLPPFKTKHSKRIRESKQMRGFSSEEQRPVSSSNPEQVNLTTLRYSLLYLISEQIDRTKAFAYAQLSQTPNPYSLAGKKGFISNSILEELLRFLKPRKGAVLIYNILTIFGDRVENPAALYREISAILSEKPIYNYPSFLPFYVKQNKNEPEKLRQLNYWRAPHIPLLLQYLDKDYQKSPALQRYVTKVLAQLEADQILFYLPQIFQALTLQSGKIVAHFLLQYARKSSCFAHQLIWLAKVESKQEKDPHNKAPRPPEVELHLARLLKEAKKIIRKTMCQFNREEKAFFHEVDGFYEQVTAISGRMKPTMPPSDKKQVIDKEVARIRPPKSAYLPFNTTFQVIEISRRSGTPMQSAAKCPFLLTFSCCRYEGPDLYFSNQKAKRLQNKLQDSSDDDLPQEEAVKPMNSMEINGSRMVIPIGSRVKSEIRGEGSLGSTSQHKIKSKPEHREISCIFKVFDDIRQDCLALQVIRLFLQIFQRHKLDLKLFPYHTLSNRTGVGLDVGGIIEVVPNCVSRDAIGKTNQQSLYQFFLSNFGQQHNMAFQSARQNFIRSQAAYSIVSYIMQVKDRHNGNILVDKEQGFLVHIDFGFILEISPANNLRFERAAFKLTEEMIKIMGGSIESEPFQLYLTLVIKGFLIVRRYHKHVQNLVGLMFRSGLPCFLPKALQNLEARFFLELSEIEAAQKMREIVLAAADNWTTNWYDRIQWIQQKIYH